jgi:hypothetical protein
MLKSPILSILALQPMRLLLTSFAGATVLTLGLSGLAQSEAQAQQVPPQAPLRSPMPAVADLEADPTANPAPLVPPVPLSQVTSVSQLSDVKPTDWAYQAVQSLVERYGCIVGYPNSTFRGNRAATRYELAAALNACLDVMSDRFATKEDLLAVRKLQEEFAKELATLKGRVNQLETRTAKLESQQFSTTTKLTGEAIIAFQAGQNLGGFTAFNGDNNSFNRVRGGSLNPTVVSRVDLSLASSFTGKDTLDIVLRMGNNGGDAIGGLGVGTAGFINAGALDYAFTPSNVDLYRLAYTFKPKENIAITVGPRIYPSDFIDSNSYANDPGADFGSGFFINNRLIVPLPVDGPGGAGAAFNWNFGGGPLTLRGLYIAATANDPVPNVFGGGLFGDPYQGSLELEYANKFGKDGANNFAVRLQYTNSRTFDIGQNALGLNVEASFGRFGVFGRYAYSFARFEPDAGDSLLPFAVPPGAQGNFRAQTWMVGAGYKDLLVPGSMLAFAVGQPFINNLPENLNADAPNNARQTNYELFYRFPVNDNISVTPALMVITNANNNDANSTIIQGVLRTTFTF